MQNIDKLVRRSTDSGLSYVSLFCGAGGLDIGFYKAGFNPVLAVDHDKDAIATYKSVFGNHEILQKDLSKYKVIQKADLLIGGPPCQGFSVAGYGSPDDPRSKHILTFMKTLKNVKPKVFVMENVKALAISEKWVHKRKQLVKHAEKLGYEAKFFVLNSADYGVPQSRERMFFIGVKNKNSFDIDKIKKVKRKTVRSALLELPEYGALGNDLKCTAKIVIAKNPVIRGGAYSGMFFNGKGRILNIDRPSLTLPASMGGNHTPIIDQLNLVSNKSNWAESCFKILISKKPILKQVPLRLRRLTVQEAAAIQSFPKKMSFKGNTNSQFRQIGNAVPPQLAFSLAKAIREQIFKS